MCFYVTLVQEIVLCQERGVWSDELKIWFLKTGVSQHGRCGAGSKLQSNLPERQPVLICQWSWDLLHCSKGWSFKTLYITTEIMPLYSLYTRPHVTMAAVYANTIYTKIRLFARGNSIYSQLWEYHLTYGDASCNHVSDIVIPDEFLAWVDLCNPLNNIWQTGGNIGYACIVSWNEVSEFQSHLLSTSWTSNIANIYGGDIPY